MKILAMIIAIVAGIAGYAVYTGHRSSTEALEHGMSAARAAGLRPIEAFVTRYATQGNTTYTCGFVQLDSDGSAPVIRSFVVLQTGATLDYLGTHFEGEKNFTAAYAEHCL